MSIAAFANLERVSLLVKVRSVGNVKGEGEVGRQGPPPECPSLCSTRGRQSCWGLKVLHGWVWISFGMDLWPMLLDRARLKGWSYVERATWTPGELQEEVSDGKPLFS